MDSPDLEDFFTQQWTSATKSCSERMEPQDRRTIRSFRTYEDVQEHVFAEQDELASEAALHELAMLQPRLVDLKKLSDFFTQLRPTLDTGMFWGLLGLLLTLALQHDETMRRVVQMLQKISRNCHDFILHCRQSPVVTKEDKESCFDIFLRITTFLADVVQFLRQADDDVSELTYASGRNHPAWTELTEKFTTAVDDIKDTLDRIDRVAAMYQRQYQGDMASWFSYLSLSPRAFRDTAQLPCFVLPPIRTARFFDRDDVIEKVEKHFQDGESTSSLRSLALYGMGGVGKSHVAMKYLDKKLAIKNFEAIFWINAENPVSIQQSFTDIALKLKLPDTGPASHDENRMILKGWLQQTECKWMIIYDNAETIELLRDYWPLSGSNGRVLITTRNHMLGFDPADAGLEILPWDTDTGSKFLLHLLTGHISAELLANETQSAYSLSERLSGHALALSNMCGLIHRRSWSISELVEVYDRSKDFKDGLETVWQLSFENLKPDCAALLSVFTFCAPDSIPQSLFEFNEEKDSLTDDMLWYLDSDRLSTSTEELLALALIKRDGYDRVFSIHRLIAAQFRRFLNPKDLQKAFCEASILMYNAFPKRPKKPGAARANLYNVWDRCQLCYLLETQNWRELEDLVIVNRIAMETLPEPDKEIYLLSSTEIHVASMWAFRGGFKMALKSLLTAHSLKLAESTIDLQNTCWIEDNLASIYGCLGDFDTAIEWNERSHATWKRWSESTGVEFKCPPLLKLTRGRILTHGGRLDESREQLTEAVGGLLSAEPFVWAPTATCKFAIGRLLMFEGKYEAAESMLLESQSMWLQGDKSRALDFNGIIVYQLGCCAMMQGGIDAALKHLQEAKVISSIHKDTHPAKYARCLLKLSEALRQVPGREAEADQRLTEAKDLYFQIIGKTRATAMERSKDDLITRSDQVKEEDFDALIHISQR
ncbi:hypothetical protein V492_00130 [Pseudogymnoascus sp. VKM F-4246]|nr:hypothetical protein V492_00130 [Pseudogymnoascus sp. VKM F-4246]